MIRMPLKLARAGNEDNQMGSASELKLPVMMSQAVV